MASLRALDAWGLDGLVDMAVEPDVRRRCGPTVVARTVDGPDGPVLHADWIRPAVVLDDPAVADLAASWSRALRGAERLRQARGPWSARRLVTCDRMMVNRPR